MSSNHTIAPEMAKTSFSTDLMNFLKPPHNTQKDDHLPTTPGAQYLSDSKTKSNGSSPSDVTMHDIPGEEEKMRKDLTDEERLNLVKVIAELSTDDLGTITRAADNVLPEDVALNQRFLSAALHPDKFKNKAEKQQAQLAFQRKIIIEK